ncbi:MAG: hypothetical protein SOV18_01135 [Eubacteriales bacterium]|nr:hypothetical protein [Eubacteriales bacterium]
MKKCITKKALCILLSALLTVSVFATCLVFSASADDAIVIDNFANYAGSTTTIMTRVGEAKTLGSVRNAVAGVVNDYNYFYVITCDGTGKVLATYQTLGRPDGVKTDVEIPEGGFALLCNATAGGAHTQEVIDSFKAIETGKYVALNNVDLAALAAAGKVAALSGASFTVSDTPAVTTPKVVAIKFESADGKTSEIGRNCTTSALIDGDTVSAATAHSTNGLVLFMNSEATQAEAFNSFTLTVEADKLGHVDGGALSFYVETGSMIGLPKDFKVAVKASDDGVTFTDKGEIVLENAKCEWDASDASKNTIGVQTFNFTADFNAKYVQFVITFGKSPYTDKPTFEFVALSEVAVNFSDAKEESSEEPSTAPSESKNLALDATVLNTPEYVDTESLWPCS